jgi:hypothetical protein
MSDIYNDVTISCDGEPLKLPADTLAILNEFYQEQNENSRKEEQGDIGEDWVKYCLIISCKILKYKMKHARTY